MDDQLNKIQQKRIHGAESSEVIAIVRILAD